MRPAKVLREKLTYLFVPNSGPTTKTQEDIMTGFGTVAGAIDIAGQRAVLLVGGIQKERVIVLGPGRGDWVTVVSVPTLRLPD